MTPPPVPENEPERLEALRHYDILDTLPEQVFDDLTLLAAELLDAPIALISFVDVERQWFKSRRGIDDDETTRDVSFCAHTLTTRKPLVVRDTHEDARFADNPLVVGDPGLRFYAGAPLVTEAGHCLGTLCVADTEPREFAPDKLARLEALGRQVMSQLELRRALRDREEVARRLESFFEVTPDLHCIASPDGTFFQLSPAWEKHLGYELDELMSRPFLDFVHPDDVEPTLAQMAHLDDGKDTIGFTNRYRRADGTYCLLEWNSAFLPSEGLIFAAARDVTEVRTLVEQLREARDLAESSNRAKSTFLANMSHELRTPLNSIIGFTNILRKNKSGNLTPRQLDFVERIFSNGRHLLSLLNDVLDLSKIEAGHVEIERADVDLTHLLDDVKVYAEGLNPVHPVCFTVPAGAHVVSADPRRLKQVLINLIGNAVKFTPEGHVEVELIVDDAGCPMRIDVIDEGIGVSDEQRARIFSPFVQGDESTTRRFGGTGLGLSISRSLCQTMGFDLELTSELGVGAVFSVRLAESAPALVSRLPRPCLQRPVGASAQQHPGSGAFEAVHDIIHRVLVIDDDDEARSLYEHQLEGLGVEIVHARSGREGIHFARERDPAAIILDLMIPDVDGFEVFRTLRSEPSSAKIPIIICSIVGDENRSRLAGAAAVLDKPLNPNRLRSILRSVLLATRTELDTGAS